MKKILFTLSLLGLLACQQNKQGNSWNSQTDNNSTLTDLSFISANENLITVTDLSGHPIDGAQILIGSKLGVPFIHNLFKTNSQGQVAIPPEWNGVQSVTVNHPKYLRSTYLNIKPQALNFKLRPLDSKETFEISGVTSNFGNLESDDTADFGLVIQALTKEDLLTFKFEKLISPEMDTFDILGFESKIPSNLTLPEQDESYSLVPITLKKERFRLYTSQRGNTNFFALHGQFPFEKVVDELRNKTPFLDLMNQFKFTSGSIKNAAVNGNVNLNIPVNEISFNQFEKYNAPKVGGDKLLIAVSLFEKSGYLYPTDLHKVDTVGNINLRGASNFNRFFLSFLRKVSDPNNNNSSNESISVELVAQKANHSPVFIDLFNKPQGNASSWKAMAPKLVNGVSPLSTYSVLSKTYGTGNKKTLVREWEVYSQNWSSSVVLPEWPTFEFNEFISSEETQSTELLAENQGQRWDITYIGSNQGSSIPAKNTIGPRSLDYVTHISYNNVEF